MLNRRNLLAFAPASASGQPGEFHLPLMWRSPVAPFTAETWRLQLKGLVEKPRQIPLTQLRALLQQTQTSRRKRAPPGPARASRYGFRFHQLLDIGKPPKKATAVRIDCADKWYEYFNLEDLRQPNVIFVPDLAGQPLPDPSRYDYKSARLIMAITFAEMGKGGMVCDIGPCYSPGGKTKRKITGGEITEY